jgi:hypothetical protein
LARERGPAPSAPYSESLPRFAALENYWAQAPTVVVICHPTTMAKVVATVVYEMSDIGYMHIEMSIEKYKTIYEIYQSDYLGVLG